MKEKILSVQVLCDEFCPEVRSKKMRVVLVPFTGEAFGPYFNGKIIGPGVDTQKFSGEHEMVLSARYMLEGKDHTGQKCRIFIENTLHDENGWHPIIVTDKPGTGRMGGHSPLSHGGWCSRWSIGTDLQGSVNSFCRIHIKKGQRNDHEFHPEHQK